MIFVENEETTTFLFCFFVKRQKVLGCLSGKQF